MLRSLTIANAGAVGAELAVYGSEPCILGRAPFADVALPDQPALNFLISRRHASVQLQGENLVLTDLGSLNGTWYEPSGHHKLQRLVPRVPEVLEPGSTVYFGGQKVVMDNRGAKVPNPHVYLYLGACHHIGKHGQDCTAATRLGGSSVPCMAGKQQQQQQQTEQGQQLPSELQQCHRQGMLNVQPQQQERCLGQQQDFEQQLCRLAPEEIIQQQQQKQQQKRPRLVDLQMTQQTSSLSAVEGQQLLAAINKRPSRSCSTGDNSSSKVVQEQHPKAAEQQEQQEQQLLLYRQQRQQHHKEQQQLQQQSAAPGGGGGQHWCQYSALADLDVNQPGLPQDAAAMQHSTSSSHAAVQVVHFVGGAADRPDVQAEPAVLALAAAGDENAGSMPQRNKAGQSSSKRKEQDKDMRQVSSSHLDCAVCKDLLAAAHALACGHMFCGVCLAQWLELRQDPSCPSCRAPVKSVPVRLFGIDGMVAEAQFSQCSECQEHAARLQQWNEIKEATMAHWQRHLHPDNSCSKHDSKRAGRPAAGGRTAQLQTHPQMLAGVVPLLGHARQGGASTPRQGGITSAAAAAEQPAASQGHQQHRQPGRRRYPQQANTDRAAVGAADAGHGLGPTNTAGRRAASRLRGPGQQGRQAGGAPQQPVASRPPMQLLQHVREVPRNLRQLGINTYMSGAADVAGRQGC